MALTKEEAFFVLVVVVNFLIAALYLLWGVFAAGAEKRKEKRPHADRKSYLLHFLVMVFCPVIGPLFFAAAYLLYLTVFRFQADLEDVIFHKERVRTQTRAEEAWERDLVPAEEALLINDKRSLRRNMMNMLKSNMQEYLSSVAPALDAEDPETAHYAASALSDVQNAFRIRICRMNLRLQEEGLGETALEEEMLDDMDSILKQRVFTKMEQNRFVRMMEHTAELLYRKDPVKFAADRYEAVCMRLLETEDFADCEKWCLRLARQYSNQLSAFTCRLKLYFTVKNKDEFFRILGELKKSDVMIDSETLEMIRMFQ